MPQEELNAHVRKEREGVMAHKRLRQEDHLESGVSLSYIVSSRPGLAGQARLQTEPLGCLFRISQGEGWRRWLSG